MRLLQLIDVAHSQDYKLTGGEKNPASTVECGRGRKHQGDDYGTNIFQSAIFLMPGVLNQTIHSERAFFLENPLKQLHLPQENNIF